MTMRSRTIISRKTTPLFFRQSPRVPIKIPGSHCRLERLYPKERWLGNQLKLKSRHIIPSIPIKYFRASCYKHTVSHNISRLVFFSQKYINIQTPDHNSAPSNSDNDRRVTILFLILLLLLYSNSCSEVSANEEKSVQTKTEHDVRLERALELFHNEDFINAVTLFDSIIADYPNSTMAYELKVYCLCMQGKFDEVILTYKLAKKNKVSGPMLLLHTGQAYLALAESRPLESGYLSQKGLKYLTILIQNINFDKQLRGVGCYFLGNFYHRKGEQDAAIDFFKKCFGLIEDKNVLSECYYHLGQIYNEKGEDKFALKCFIGAVALNRKNADAFFSLGKFCEKLKLYNEAIVCYTEMYEELNEPAALFLKGRLLKMLGYHEQACLVFDTFLKSVDEYEVTDEIRVLKHDAHLMKAGSLQQLQKHNIAADNVNKAAGFIKDPIRACFLGILALLFQHKFDQAEQVINKAIERLVPSANKEDELELYHTRALVYSELYEEKIKAIIEIKQEIADGKKVNLSEVNKRLTILSQEAQELKEKMLNDLKLVLADTSNPTNSTRLNLKDKAQSLLRRYQEESNFLQKHEDTALHLAIKKRDVASMASLLSDVTVESRNEQYETPLHTAVQMGHADIVAQLLKSNANVNAATVLISYEEHTKDRRRTYPTAIELAKEKKEWDILAALLFSRQRYNEKDLTPIYDYYSGRLTREELSILLYQENIDDIMKHVQKYKAHLADRGGVVFETHSFGSLSHTQEVPLTGWDPRVFLTLRVMAFVQLLRDNHEELSSFGEITPTTFKDADLYKAKNYYDLLEINKHLKQEILYALELRRSMQDARIVYEVMKDNSIPQNSRDRIKAAHLDRVTRTVMNLENGEQYPYLTGIFERHYIYVNFSNIDASEKKKQPYARIDNIGESSEDHPYTEGTYNDKKIVGPCVFNLEDEKELRSYVEDLFTARFTYLKADHSKQSNVLNLWGIFSGPENKDSSQKKRAYSLIYRKKCCPSENLYTWPFKLPAVTGNCSVKNYDIGAEIRMGSKLFMLIRRKEYKKISEWDESFRSEWLKILDFDMTEITSVNKASQVRAKL